MTHEPINLAQKLALITEQWRPRIVAQMNDYDLRLAKIEGDFVWHSHPDTDEVFIVVQGELRIDFRDGEVRLGAGELYVVPRGVEHKPYAAAECAILLIEPSGTVNTGDATPSSHTAPTDSWI
jgi:mannose-6-phosphate isomerase-like protein (cupin superfamily)